MSHGLVRGWGCLSQVEADLRRAVARQTWRLSQAWAGRVTLCLLLAAFVVGVLGVLRSSWTDNHLIVETIAVLAGITGVYAERRAAALERRRAAVKAVRKELEDNIDLLESDRRFEPQNHESPEPRMYPRLDLAAVDSCLAQGALVQDGDHARAVALNKWRDKADTFNRGLNLTEILFYGLHFAASESPRMMIAVDEELQSRRQDMTAETRVIRDLLLSRRENSSDNTKRRFTMRPTLGRGSLAEKPRP